MGYSVSRCRSNYDTEKEKKLVFRFQVTICYEKKWLAAIPRNDFSPTEHSKVCLFLSIVENFFCTAIFYIIKNYVFNILSSFLMVHNVNYFSHPLYVIIMYS